MADWIVVVSLIVAGVLLLIVEILFVPGTTVVGVLGVIAAAIGVYLSFSYFGYNVGIWFTVGAAVMFGVALYFSFKSDAWDRFALKESMAGKVNEGLTTGLEVGLRGRAISDLKPIGKAEFVDKTFEVKTLGKFVGAGTIVEIIKINKNSILVEPINLT